MRTKYSVQLIFVNNETTRYHYILYNNIYNADYRNCNLISRDYCVDFDKICMCISKYNIIWIQQKYYLTLFKHNYINNNI